MHNLPGAAFGSKDHRNPQIDCGDILPFTNFGLGPLHPHDVGKLRSYVLRYILEANDLAISEIRRGTLHSRSNLAPSTCGRAKGVSEGYVFSMREHPLHGLRVPFDELAQRELTLLDYFVKIIYRSQLDIASIIA